MDFFAATFQNPYRNRLTQGLGKGQPVTCKAASCVPSPTPTAIYHPYVILIYPPLYLGSLHQAPTNCRILPSSEVLPGVPIRLTRSRPSGRLQPTKTVLVVGSPQALLQYNLHRVWLWHSVVALRFQVPKSKLSWLYSQGNGAGQRARPWPTLSKRATEAPYYKASRP